MLAAAAGQPQPCDRPTPRWLLSAVGGHAELTEAADAKGRQGNVGGRFARMFEAIVGVGSSVGGD
jgi:hypothetical protein